MDDISGTHRINVNNTPAPPSIPMRISAQKALIKKLRRNIPSNPHQENPSSDISFLFFRKSLLLENVFFRKGVFIVVKIE